MAWVLFLFLLGLDILFFIKYKQHKKTEEEQEREKHNDTKKLIEKIQIQKQGTDYFDVIVKAENYNETYNYIKKNFKNEKTYPSLTLRSFFLFPVCCGTEIDR